MLTARGDIESRVEGLYSGASDYLTKPFSVQELLARIHVRLRERSVSSGQIFYQDLVLDPDTISFVLDGQVTVLPDLEFQVLKILLTHRGRLFSREDLERHLYGPELPGSNTVEVFVHNLRKKLARVGLTDVIGTVRGKGYMVR
jgi:DNA-binding response OmpR family regulator